MLCFQGQEGLNSFHFTRSLLKLLTWGGKDFFRQPEGSNSSLRFQSMSRGTSGNSFSEQSEVFACPYSRLAHSPQHKLVASQLEIWHFAEPLFAWELIIKHSFSLKKKKNKRYIKKIKSTLVVTLKASFCQGLNICQNVFCSGLVLAVQLPFLLAGVLFWLFSFDLPPGCYAALAERSVHWQSSWTHTSKLIFALCISKYFGVCVTWQNVTLYWKAR